MSELALEWVDAAALAPAERAEAAGWIRTLDAHYFSLFGLGDDALGVLLCGMLGQAGSEFGASLFVRSAGRLAGLLAAFPAEEAFPRRIEVLKALLQAAPDPALAGQRVKQYGGAARRVPPSTWYLARLFVSPALRRHGVAHQLMARCLAGAHAAGRAASLHVEQGNDAALALYRRHGFVAVPALAAGGYEVMTRNKEEGA